MPTLPLVLILALITGLMTVPRESEVVAVQAEVFSVVGPEALDSRLTKASCVAATVPLEEVVAVGRVPPLVVVVELVVVFADVAGGAAG